MVPKLVYIVLEKELLNFSETATEVMVTFVRELRIFFLITFHDLMQKMQGSLNFVLL